MRGLTWVAAVLAVAGCTTATTPSDFGSGGGGGGVHLTQAAQIQVIAGDGQSDTVGVTLGAPIIVLVSDSNGQPLPHLVLNWVASHGGQVYAATTQTDSLGQSAQIWTLGDTAGVDTLQLRTVSAGGAPAVYATAVATTRPGLPSDFGTSLRGGTDTLHVGDTLDVRTHILLVRDRHLNVITNYAVGATDWDPLNSVGEPTEDSTAFVPITDTTQSHHAVYIWLDHIRFGTQIGLKVLP